MLVEGPGRMLPSTLRQARPAQVYRESADTLRSVESSGRGFLWLQAVQNSELHHLLGRAPGSRIGKRGKISSGLLLKPVFVLAILILALLVATRGVVALEA